MNCDCMMQMRDDYNIELVQGDYGSFLYNITDSENEPLVNIEQVVFTCARLKTQIELTQLSPVDFALTMNSDLTSKFTACTCTYDITLIFKGTQTPVTVIHNAGFTILKKENKLNGDSG